MTAPTEPGPVGPGGRPAAVGPADGYGAEVLRELGLEALIEFLETTSYGVCVTGDEHTWVYVNPAGERILGQPLTELRGSDYLLHFPEHERDVLLALEQTQRQGDGAFYTNTVLRPDGTEREMTWSGTVLHVDGSELAPAIFHETTPVHRALRSAARLGAAAVDPVAGAGRASVLDSLVHEAVAATRASAAVLLLAEPDGLLHVAASSGAAADLADTVRRSGAGVGELPGADDLARRRSVFLSDAAGRLGANPRTDGWAERMAPGEWAGAAQFSVRWDGRLAGSLVVVLPADVTSPSESELTFWSSLGDQASIALGADRIREHAGRFSAMSERSRIARDLHDSVSQALFSLHTRAQVVRRGLAADDRDLALQAAEDLELLSRQATSQMRELLDQLKEPAEETSDLAAALHDLSERVSRLDGLPVKVRLSPAVLPAVPTPIAEHLRRIVSEALHNAVKHAAASLVEVRAGVDRGDLTITVEDDGRGFDPTTADGVGYGQQTMRERAALCGGRLTVSSTPGTGTAVAVTVPLG